MPVSVMFRSSDSSWWSPTRFLHLWPKRQREDHQSFIDRQGELTGSFLLMTIWLRSSFTSWSNGTNGFFRIASISSRCSEATRAISLVRGSTAKWMTISSVGTNFAWEGEGKTCVLDADAHSPLFLVSECDLWFREGDLRLSSMHQPYNRVRQRTKSIVDWKEDVKWRRLPLVLPLLRIGFV